MTSIEPLSDQERSALTVAAHGYTLAAGARRLGLETRTYQRRLASAQNKLGARSRIHAVAIAATLRIIAVHPGGNR